MISKLLRAVGKQKPGRLAAFIDQAQFNGTKFVATILVARMLPVEDFGVYAFILALAYLLMRLQRSSVVLPFIVDCRSGIGLDRTIPPWIGVNLGLTLGVTLIGLSVAAMLHFLGVAEWIVRSALGLCYVAPALLVYEFTRRVLYQQNRHGAVLAMSFTFMVVQALGLAAVYALSQTVLYAAGSFALAAVVGALVGLVAVRRLIRLPSIRHFRRLADKKNISFWQTLAFLCASVFGQSMVLVVGALGGPAATASFAAVRNVTAPTMSIIGAVDSIDKPAAGRAYASGGLAKLRKSIARTRMTLLITGVPFLTLLAVFSEEILSFVYGVRYADQSTALRIGVVYYGLVVLSQPLSTQLIILERSQDMFYGALLAAIVTLSAAIPMIPAYGAAGALGAMVIGKTVYIGTYIFFIRRAYARPAKQPLAVDLSSASNDVEKNECRA